MALCFLLALHDAFAGTLTGSFALIPPGTSVNLSTNGTIDWVHWGTYTEYAYDRKAGVTPVINNYTNVGTDNKGIVSIYQFSDNTNGYTWMDGTPTINITNSTTGLWAYKGVNVGNPKPSDYIGSGFVFSVPADTTLRRLNVYAGAFNGRLRFVATLSDGSAPNYSNTTLNNTNNGPSAVYTVTYAANSPGQTLWVTNILAAGNGAIPNVTLQAAALSAVTNNNLPLVWFNSPANYTSFLTPTNATLDVSALDIDGSITNVEFFQSTNKLGEVTAAPFTFVWSNAPAGKSILTARATDNAGAARVSTPIEVYGYTTGGFISSTTAPTVTNLLLSTDGTHDWAHWGSTNFDSFDHRAGVPQLINNFSIVGTNNVLRMTNDATSWSWTNGTPISSITNSSTAVYVYGFTNGFELNLPAGTNSRTARIYTGVGAARGKFQASISDASAAMLTDDSFQNFYKNSSRTYVLNYAAASEGQTLKIRYTDVVPFDSDYANIILRSVSMDVAAPLVSLTSPVNSQHFAHGTNIAISADAQDWTGAITLVEFFADANKIGDTTNSPYTIMWTNPPEGDHLLTARATDSNGAAGTSLPVTIAVATNAKPVVVLTSPAAGAHFIEGDLITLGAQATDADDTQLTVGWYTNGVKLAETSTKPYAITWSNATAGNYTLAAIVADPNGGTGTSAPVAIVVVTNAWPIVTMASPTNGQGFFAPTNITLTAQATDTDGFVSLVEYFEDTNKLGQAAAVPYTVVWPNVAKGSHTVIAKATDDRGATNFSSAVSIVVSNRPPIVSLVQPTNSARFFEGTNLTLLANAQDLDGTVALVEFFDGTNKLGEAAAPPYSMIWSNVARGNYTLNAHATDNEGAVSISATRNISVVTNAPPSVAISTPVDGQGFTTPVNIPITANATDSDGVIRQVQFFAGTNIIGQAATTPFSMVWSNAPRGNFSLSAIGYDDWDGVTISAPVTIAISNRPPSVALVTPTNSSHFFSPGPIPIVATATDADGTVNLMEFYESTNKIGEATNAPFVLTWTNVAAGNYTFSARASDNEGAVSISEVANVFVTTNIPPTVTLSAPTNGQGFTTPLNLPITAAAADVDGTVRLVEFFESTNKIGEASNAPFSLVWSNAPRGDISLTAIAHDDWDGVTVSTPVTITVTNRPPAVSITTPTNSSHFFYPGTIPIQATAADADGFISLVEFFEDTNKIGEATNAPFAIVWTNVAAGAYFLTAQASDNEGSITVSTPIDIVVATNIPPTVTLVNPTNGATFIEGDIVHLLATAADIDGTVQRVEFFSSTNKLGECTNTPFSLLWSNLTAGDYLLRAIATDDYGDTTVSASISVTVFTNQFPSVTINTPTNGSAFFAPANVPIQATAADADGTIRLIDLLADNMRLTSSTNSLLSFVWTNAPKGPHNLTAVAKDDRGATNVSAAVSLFISNSPPFVAITTPTNNALFIEGDVILLQATASDIDGSVTRIQFFESTNELVELTNAPFSFSWSNVLAGGYALTAIATDNDGASVTSTVVNVTMVTNQFPSATINSPTNGSAFFAPTNLLITAGGSDADGRIARLDLVGDGIKLATTTNTPLSFTWTNTPKGTHSLIAVATDDRGASNASATVSFIVSNRPPLITLIGPTNNATFIEGDVITIAANAADLDGTNLVVAFFSSTNQLAQITNGPFSFNWSNVVAGSYALAAVATDNDGASVTSTVVNVTMVTNQFPSVAITSPTNGSAFFAPTNLSITATGSDSDGRIARLDLFGDSVKLTSSTNSTLSFTWTNTPKGPHTLSAVVTDNRGATNTSPFVNVIVSNRPPTIALTSPTNNSVFIEGDIITVSAAAADLDGTNLVVTFFSSTNQLAQITNGPFLLNWSNILAGNYTLTAIATDSDGASVTSAVVNVTMVTNQFPSVTINSPTNGSAFFAPTNLSISATSSDADGRIARLDLFADNVKVSTSTNSTLSFTWTNTPKGPHSLSAVATDNRGATNISPFVNVIVSNRPPTIALTSPTNSSVFIEGDIITVSAAAADLDGTNVVVTFFSSTNQLAQITNGPFSFSWSNVVAGSYTLTAVATDSDGASVTSVVANVTMVTNQFPSVAITSPTNGSAFFAPTNLSITATGSDPDGRIARLDLFGDNVKLTSTTNSTLSFTWTNTPKGPHTLSAVATDNRGATNTSPYVSVIVSNRPPTIAFTSPTNNSTFIEGDVITIAATASDLDGTNLVVKFFAATNQFAQITNGPFNFSWSNVLAGSYTLTAIATDNDGASVTSAVVNVTMVTNQFPSALITFPTNGSGFFAPTNLSIATTGSDADGRIVRLELFGDNVKLATSTNTPLSFIWTNTPKGGHSLIAVATDDRGATNVSPTVNLVVSNRPPTVALISPTNNSTFIVGDGITLSATASDADGTNVLVQFFAGTNVLTQFTNAPYSFIWTNAVIGNYTLTAVATDNDGATNVSTAVNITVKTNQFPSVVITTPTNGATLYSPIDLPITATAADVDGSITKLSLLADGVKLGETTNTVLTLTWSNAPNGTHLLTAVAMDDRQASNTTANTISVIPVAPNITSQPQSQTIVAGTNANFVVAATGSPPLRYQWRLNGTNVSSTTNSSYTITNAQPANNGSYAVIVSNNFGSITSSPALLTVNFALNIASTAGGAVTKNPDRPSFAPGTVVTLTALTNWPYSFTGWSGGLSGTNNPRTVTMNSNLTAVAQFTPFIADLIIDNPQAYATGAWSSATSATNKYGTNYLTVKALQGTSPTATAVYTPNIPGAGGYDIYAWWPTFTKASTSVPILISSGGSNVTFFVNQSTGGGAWQLVASNRFFAAGTNGFGRISNDQAPQSLKDMVADAMRWVYATNQTAWPPAILAGLSNQVAIAGSLMNFSVAAVGASPLAYQWRFNGTNIAGETNATLTFAPVQPSHAGNYQVVVTNPAGAATSAVASLTVILPAQIATQPQSQRVLAGTTTLFTVAATGTSPLAYQWRFNTTPISRATNASLSLTNVQLTNVGGYDVIVTNAGGAVTSTVATLSLNSPPAVTLLPTNGAHYIEKDVIGVDVFSSDTDGSVTNILLLADGITLMQWTGGGSNHFNWNSAAIGSHVLKAVVTDNDGATNLASSTISVVTNQFPSAAITTPTNGAHYIAPTNLLVNATASDADGTVTNLQVRVDGTLVLSQTNGNNLSLVWSNALKGTHTLTAAAVDDRGATNISIPVTITISNRPPTIVLVTPTNNSAYIEGDVIPLAATANDADGTNVLVRFLAGTNTLVSLSNAPYNFNWSNVVAGTYALSAAATDNDGATVTSAVVNVTMLTNQSPSVAITTPTNGAHYLAPTNLLINATASDADGTVTNLQVRVDGSLVLSQTNGSSLSIVWSNALKGSHTLTAVAVDDRGATNISAVINIIISNRPPTIALVTPTNNAVFIEGDVIPLSATASDADGTNVLVRFLAGTNTLVSFTNAPYSFNWSNVVAGAYALSAAATDNDGATVTSAVVNVTMHTNQFPSVVILSPTNGSSFSAPANLGIQASASDADGTVRLIEVFADGIHLAQSTNNSINFVWTNTPKGSHVLTAVVTDDRGATNRSTTVNVSVTNAPPFVTLTTPTNGSQYIQGDTIIVSAQASDSDGVFNNVQLLEGTNILALFTNAPFTYAWSNAVAGHYVLTSRAVDNDGAVTTSGPVNITIVTNQNPAINFITPTNGQSFVAPLDLPIAVSASDTDGSVHLVELRTDGVLIAQSSTNTASTVWTNVPKGAHVLTAFAVDDRGATNVAIVNISVTNALPLINLLTPTNGTKFIQGDTISMAATATDPDGVIMSVAFFEATNLLATVTNAPFVYAWSNAAPGIYSLTAQATDNDNGTVLSSNVTITVVTNQPPLIELLSPTNTEAFLSPAAITMAAAASDADGQVRLVQFFENTNKLSEITNGPYVFVWTNVLHGNYTLSSVATDDRGAVTASAPIQIVVARRTQTLVLSNATPSTSGFTFDFATAPEWTYRIEASDSLQSSNWTVVTNIVGDGTPVSISTSFSTNQQMFYRVVAQ